MSESKTSGPVRKVRRSIAMLLAILAPGLGLLYLGKATAAWTMLGLVFAYQLLFILAGFGNVMLAVALSPFLVLVILAGLIWTWRAMPKDGIAPQRKPIWLLAYAGLVVAALASNLAFTNLAPIKALSHPSESMRPLFSVGDLSWSARATAIKPLPELRRGDVVSFWAGGFSATNPECPKDRNVLFVARVVGLPGDTVAMENNILLVNGKAIATGIPELFTAESDGNPISGQMVTEAPGDGKANYQTWILGNQSPVSTVATVTVPDSMVYLLGDNRDNSVDSRLCGSVPLASVAGIVTHRYRHEGKWGITAVE